MGFESFFGIKPYKNTLEAAEQSNHEKDGLTLEAMEAVMKQVVDITKDGTIMTTMISKGFEDKTSEWDLERLDDILRMGLLGRSPDTYRDTTGNSMVKQWVDESRKGTAAVWVNVVGRSLESVPQNALSFVINASSFNESFPVDSRHVYTGESRSIKLDADQESSSWNFQYPDLGKLLDAVRPFGFNENSRLDDVAMFAKSNPEKVGIINGLTPIQIIDSYRKTSQGGGDTGFMIARRVAPRDINGIVLGTSFTFRRDKKSSEIIAERMNVLVQEMIKVYKEKPELIKPIYNSEGDLLWPKKISRAEIVKMSGSADAATLSN